MSDENTKALVTEERARFAPPRLPFHDAIGERYGIDRSGWKILTEVLYPAAKSADSIVMVLGYCKARNLDVFKRPVYIVPMWSSAQGGYVDTIWPGIAELRTTAFRTGNYAGCDETQFGPTIEKTFKGRVKKDNKWEDIAVTVKFPEWAQVTVYRLLGSHVCKFVGPKTYWVEAYANQGKSDIPVTMWEDRPIGQIEKCAEAGALRKAFPEELGNQMSAEEMEGRTVSESDEPTSPRQRVSEKLKGGNGDGFQHDHVMSETAQEPEKPKRGRPKATPVETAAEEVAADGIPGEPEQAENTAELTDAEVVDEIAETPKEEVNQEVTEDGPQATQTEDAGSVTAQNGNQSEAQDMESAQSAENHREIAGESDVSRSDAFEAFNAQVDQAKSWAEIDAAFMALYTTEDWKFAEEWERRATRVTMWTRVEALRTETKSIIIDPRDNAKAFLCWLECVKEGEESKVNMLFKQLQATPTYKKFNDEQRAHIENQVKGALERIGKK